MEPIQIALIVSVLFNLWCFKEIKLLQRVIKNKTERHNQQIECYKQELSSFISKGNVKSLGYVNVYEQPNGRTRITPLPKDKLTTKQYRCKNPINKLLGTSEVFISKPEK